MRSSTARLMLVVTVSSLAWSSAAFGTTYTWTGATNSTWTTDTNWLGGVHAPSNLAGTDVNFDSNSAGPLPTGSSQNGYNLDCISFNTAFNYGIGNSGDTLNGFNNVANIWVNQPDCYTIYGYVAQTTGTTTVNTVANSTLQFIAFVDPFVASTTHSLVINGSGSVVVTDTSQSARDGLSVTLNNTASLSYSAVPGSSFPDQALMYSLVSSSGSSLTFNSGSWYIYSSASAPAPGSIGYYNMAKPAVFMPEAWTGSTEDYTLFNITAGGSIYGLNAQFLRTGTIGSGGTYARPWCGTNTSSDSDSGQNLSFTDCKFSGNDTFWMVGDRPNPAYPTGHGPAYTMTARGVEFIPNSAASLAGIFTIAGDLTLAKDASNNPCELLIDIIGTGGVAGTDYSQLQVNAGASSAPVGGVLTGLNNMTLVLYVQSGVNLSGLTFNVLQTDCTTSTNFSTLGQLFANDSGGVNGWSDGTYKGTLTYNSNDVVLSNVHLASVPEPATLFLSGTGAAGAIGWMRRRRVK